jgi:hypothetical protein
MTSLAFWETHGSAWYLSCPLLLAIGAKLISPVSSGGRVSDLARAIVRGSLDAASGLLRIGNCTTKN